MLSHSEHIRQYMVITANYWAFTLTDGALRMLVVLYFHKLGYSPLEIATVFIFYEFFGVVTNLVGGWLGARWGLNKIMNIGLFLQVVALSLLLVPASYLTVVWVMVAQAISGVAKDLNKMSAKSAIKFLVPSDQSSKLFHWVALLTGSKNTLKGIGFFVGAVLLSLLGFKGAVLAMAIALLIVWIISLFLLTQDLGRSPSKPKFTSLFSKTSQINYLSAARMFLFGSRDVWFVVALPVFLSSKLGWSHTMIGTFFAIWIIIYGVVQVLAPRVIFKDKNENPGAREAFMSAISLAIVPILIVFALHQGWHLHSVIVIGLAVFGVAFAINSSLHSFLIVEYASAKQVSLDVGFYYMANAMGRLIGTVLSGLIYQLYGLEACLIVSGLFLITASMLSLRIDNS